MGGGGGEDIILGLKVWDAIELMVAKRSLTLL